MRIAVVGASELGVSTARLLLAKGHQVVLIEAERARIDELYDELDCSFLCGDGSRPAILREAQPNSTDVLFCLTGDDRVNIVTALAGRSLGFKDVVTSIENTEYEDLCAELGLQRTVVPPRTIGRYLADMVDGADVLELSTFVRGDARFFAFAIDADHDGTPIADLGVPKDARVICFYRGEELHLPTSRTRLHTGDEVVVLTRSGNLAALREKWQPLTNDNAKR